MISFQHNPAFGSSFGALFGARPEFEACEERVAEVQFEQKVEVALGGRWWWLTRRNVLTDHRFSDGVVRVAFTWRNWAHYVRPAWYYSNIKYFFSTRGVSHEEDHRRSARARADPVPAHAC